ncbi:MAG TPA: MerR family transcriptional regulator [Candidatus Nanopelagicaceae bacterium]
MEEFLTVASVARRLGVAPATLRTWDRRYGLGPTHHKAGEHRRYSAGDVAKLTLMRRLITTGVMPREAAETARIHTGEIVLDALVEEIRVHEELVDALYRAAFALDAALIETGIRLEIAKSGIVRAWQEVIVPLLERVGQTWAETGKGIEVEHLLTEIIKRILRHIEVVDPVNPRPVLLAAVGDELHSLPTLALAAALAESNIQTYSLGPRTPLDALKAMVKRSAPPAIFLWAQMPQHADSKFFREVPIVRPAPRIILGGPGWMNVELGAIVHAKNLQEAYEEITWAIGVETHR